MTGTAYADSYQLGDDGTTKEIYSYTDATRERVFIPVAGIDQDNDGVTDRVAVDIIRPKESGPDLKVPAIIDDSPYYTSLGRGNEAQFIHTTPAGTLDQYPLFYDNYFVPRGYAVMLAQAVGTAFSTGCPLHGGPGDVAGFKAVIDWTKGRVPAYTTVDGTTPAVADWSNGKNAMIGKSYDGTFANGVAATGVDGLTTIVPISAISDWYDYSRMGGVRLNTGAHYPARLSDTITSNQPASVLGVVPPDRNVLCKPTRDAMSLIDGDNTGDINDFWDARDYNKDVANVKAAVFASHGINDDNVKTNHISQWWAGLAANNVPRKMWLGLEGHVDPFEYRRAKWVDTLHRWFDYWLYGVQNDIMSQPRIDVETAKDTWATYADWPIPGTKSLDLFLQGDTAATAGKLGMQSGGATDTLQWTDLSNQNEATMIASPTGSQLNRRVFLSQPLTHDLHLSGTPIIDIQASLSKTQSNLNALLVDYGAATKVNGQNNTNGGVTNTVPSEKTCWGQSTATDSACYIEINKVTVDVNSWRIAKGVLDSSNRDSLFTPNPVTIDQKYDFRFPTLPVMDYTVPAGHQLGIVLVANFSGSDVNGMTGTTVTLDTKLSKVSLPIVGGYGAAVASGAFAAETVPPVLGPVPADISTTSSTAAGAAVTYALPTATDDVDPNPTVTCTPASGSVFAVGTTTVSCTAADASGNTSAAKAFKVTVTEVAPVSGTVTGSVPATLSLTLGTPASFGSLTAGLAHDYGTQTPAGVISTAGNAALTVADPSSTATGHLVNGAFSLPSALQANAGGPFADVGGSSAPTLLKSWTAPVSNDPVTIAFQQHIGPTDALRTGTYSKTLTFTLSTTAP